MASDLIKRVSVAIAERRRELGITQEGLADRLDIAVQNVQRLESGKQNLTLATFERVATALQTTPDAMLALTFGRDMSEPVEVEVEASSPLARFRAAGFPVRAATQRGRRSARGVPIMTLRAAGGALEGGASLVGVLGWVTLARTPPPKGQFVAEIAGKSMEPRVPDGALCLFGPPGPPPYRDRLFLVAHPSLPSDDLDGPFALKKVAHRGRPDGTAIITLRSINPDYPPIVIDTRTDDDVRVIAELVRVVIPTETNRRVAS